MLSFALPKDHSLYVADYLDWVYNHLANRIPPSFHLPRSKPMKKTLYQYAVLKHTPLTDGTLLSEIVVEPTEWFLASNRAEVEFLALRAVPEQHAKDHARLEVLVRPFRAE